MVWYVFILDYSLVWWWFTSIECWNWVDWSMDVIWERNSCSWRCQWFHWCVDVDVYGVVFVVGLEHEEVDDDYSVVIDWWCFGIYCILLDDRRVLIDDTVCTWCTPMPIDQLMVHICCDLAVLVRCILRCQQNWMICRIGTLHRQFHGGVGVLVVTYDLWFD